MWELAFVAVALLVVVLVLRGPPELARLEVRDGKTHLVKGRMPKRLLDDASDVLSDPAIARAEVRLVVEGGRPRVVARGLSDAKLQQLRNITGSYSTAQIRAGRVRAR